MAATVTQLKTRQPTGRPGWPRILLSGEEGARKSWTLAELSADDRIGTMLWLEIGAGESTADEYGAIPGVKYQIIDHDGTWADIYTQLSAGWDVAKAAEDNGDLPVALAVDSMSGVWQMLVAWGDLVARRREATKLEKRNQKSDKVYSPDFQAQMHPDIWNLVNRRWGQFMSKVLTWPGPVGMTAREKLITAFDDRGTPDPRKPKEWSLETQKGLGFQSTVWLRLTRAGRPEIVKLRSVREGVNPGQDGPQKMRGDKLSLAAVVFDVIGCEVGVSRAAQHRELNADQTMPGEETPAPEEQPQRGRQQPARRAPAGGQELTPEQRAAQAVTQLLTTADRALVTKIAEYAATTPAFARLDVGGLLTDEDRDRLDAGPKSTSIRLAFLAELVGNYIDRTGTAVRTVTEEAPAA